MLPSEIVERIGDLISSESELGRAVKFAEYESDELNATVTVGVCAEHLVAAKKELVSRFGPTIEVVEADRGGIS